MTPNKAMKRTGGVGRLSWRYATDLLVALVIALGASVSRGAEPIDSRRAGTEMPEIELKKCTPSTEVGPVLISAKNPEYPTHQFRSGITGSAKVRFTVGLTGKVIDVEEVESSAPEFLRATVQAVSRWLFKPATDRGEPLEVKCIQLHKFDIEDQDFFACAGKPPGGVGRLSRR